jgi:hypothetical protein
MTSSKPGGGRIRMLPGLAISAAAVLLLIFAVDWRKTAEAWSGAELWVLAPAVLCILLAMLTRAAAWRTLMGDAVPFGRCFWVLTISYLLNGILPFRLGDLARAYLVGREKDGSPPRVSAGSALSAVALERMFDLAFTCVLVLSLLPMIAGMEFGGRVILTAFGLALAFFIGLFVLGSARLWILGFTARLTQRFPVLRPVGNLLDHFLTGLAEVRNLRRSVPAFLWIVVTMLLWAAEYWVVLRGFFPDASAGWGLLSLVGGLIGVAVPSAPSSLGVFEGSVTVVLTMGGMAQATAVAYAIAIHLLNILALSALGVLGLIVEGRSLGSILALAKPAEK